MISLKLLKKVHLKLESTLSHNTCQQSSLFVDSCSAEIDFFNMPNRYICQVCGKRNNKTDGQSYNYIKRDAYGCKISSICYNRRRKTRPKLKKVVKTRSLRSKRSIQDISNETPSIFRDIIGIIMSEMQLKQYNQFCSFTGRDKYRKLPFIKC